MVSVKSWRYMSILQRTLITLFVLIFCDLITFQITTIKTSAMFELKIQFFLVLLIGRPGRGWRLADRPGRIFMQKIVILLISGLIISFADFFGIFPFFYSHIKFFFNQLKLFTNRLALFSLFRAILATFEPFC